MAGTGKDKAIGIDLGTTYSCVGVWQHDRVQIIVNDQGNRTTLSMLAFTSEERLVGDAAKFQVSTNPHNTVFDAKRLIGRRFSDPCVQSDIKLWPFAVVNGKDDKPMVEVSYKDEKKLFAAEEISSMVLMKMKMIAEEYLNCDVNKAVITVPAYFNNSQRQATIDAGKIAGLNVMRIIPEPTAAAITYGLHASNIEKKNVLIFDLGGGTFDACVLIVGKGKIYVKAIAGDMHLGGEDFDNRMVNYCVEQFNRKFNLDLSTSSSPKALRRLRSESERAKRCLSSALETVIDIDSLYEGQDFHMKITRVKFEKLNADLFQKCMETVKKCLVDAKMEKHQIEEVVLVGGSSRIPKVHELLRQFFGEKNLCKSVNPDEAVAYGAAMQAAFLNNEPINLVLVDVTPLSLGISVSNGVMKAVVSKNTPIPSRMETIVTTMYDNQVGVHFEVYEGERALVVDNYFLDEFILRGIPPAPCGVPNIKVCFEVDADGILKVLAQDQATGLSNGITIYKEREIQNKEEIDRMVSEAEKFRREDEEAKKKHLAKHNLECYICNMRDRVTERRTKGRKKKQIAANITRILNDVEEWLDENDDIGPDELTRKLEDLKIKLPPIPVPNL